MSAAWAGSGRPRPATQRMRMRATKRRKVMRVSGNEDQAGTKSLTSPEMTHHRAGEVLEFWFGKGAERGKAQKRWFEKNAAFDADVRARFLPLYETLARNADWLSHADDCLAR